MHQTKLDWQTQAACIGKPTNWFFPENESFRDRRPYERGIAVCESCPVRITCLNYAMEWEADQRYRFGVFGGLSPHERTVHEPYWIQRR